MRITQSFSDIREAVSFAKCLTIPEDQYLSIIASGVGRSTIRFDVETEEDHCAFIRTGEKEVFCDDLKTLKKTKLVFGEMLIQKNLTGGQTFDTDCFCHKQMYPNMMSELRPMTHRYKAITHFGDNGDFVNGTHEHSGERFGWISDEGLKWIEDDDTFNRDDFELKITRVNKIKDFPRSTVKSEIPIQIAEKLSKADQEKLIDKQLAL